MATFDAKNRAFSEAEEFRIVAERTKIKNMEKEMMKLFEKLRKMFKPKQLKTVEPKISKETIEITVPKFVFKEKEIEVVVPKIAERIKRQDGLSVTESNVSQAFKFCLLRGTPSEVVDNLVTYYGKRPFEIYGVFYDSTNGECTVLLSHA